ncbi:unnamed protein product [Sphagnum jensenii]|uniref:Uncharacterized protein n=1 Tax=Sphagnum jensenii TaxID=128206 RepID=A0ABP0W8M8_9BRYO
MIFRDFRICHSVRRSRLTTTYSSPYQENKSLKFLGFMWNPCHGLWKLPHWWLFCWPMDKYGDFLFRLSD